MGNNGEDNTDWLGGAAPPAVILKGKNNAPFADGAGNSDDPVQGGAAKLGCDLVDRAERPVTAGGIEFEDRTRLHREAVINLWRRQHDSGSRWSGARSSLLRIGMFGVLSFQQAFPEQSLHLSAYGGARAVQAI